MPKERLPHLLERFVHLPIQLNFFINRPENICNFLLRFKVWKFNRKLSQLPEADEPLAMDADELKARIGAVAAEQGSEFRVMVAANADVPIWLGHGTQDEVVVLPRAEATRDALQSLGYTVQWHSYPMGHTVCLEEIADLQRWLQQVLAV